MPVGTLIYRKRSRDRRDAAGRRPHAGRAARAARARAAAAGSATRTSPRPPTARRARCSRASRAKSSISTCTLKLLADVGLVGFPNAGKSTLISVISAAKPKIADYPFTTLTPNLGVVALSGDRDFVVADVPGLIEGAHEGHGLGHQFLRHIERTKVLIHLVDVSGARAATRRGLRHDPRELEFYNPELLEKPQLVAANKIDALDDPAQLRPPAGTVRPKGIPHAVSTAAGRGQARAAPQKPCGTEVAAARGTSAIAERMQPRAGNPDAE